MTYARTAENSFAQSSPRRSGMLSSGGKELADLRTMVAWSAIPLIVSGIIYIVALGLFRTSADHAGLASSLCAAAQSMLRLGEIFFILGLWRFAIYFACSNEARAFPLRQRPLVRALTAAIVVSALFALAIVMLAPAATSLGHTVAAAMSAV
ncbi:MAG TPA: hypothetical protein VMV15_10230 [Candidatus Binataceae bacterium]|nr:hypothetical protein [Candidatus Binataceae bacterium]